MQQEEHDSQGWEPEVVLEAPVKIPRVLARLPLLLGSGGAKNGGRGAAAAAAKKVRATKARVLPLRHRQQIRAMPTAGTAAPTAQEPGPSPDRP